MAKLEARVRRLEADAARVDLDSMTDEELMSYAGAHWVEPSWGSRECVAAVLTMVMRKPSAFLPVPTDKLPPDDSDFIPQFPYLSGEANGQT